MVDARYTTQLQAGLGMISETMELLRLWKPEMIPSRLTEQVIENGLFARATARRARNIVMEMFAPRFMSNGGETAGRLRYLLDHRFPQDALIQIFFLQTARAQRIFEDFVIEVFWPKYSAGATALSRDDAKRFVWSALDDGKMIKRWSDSTIRRVSGYLLGCCVDFGLLGEGAKSSSPILRYSIRREVALYLAYDLHESGLSDMLIVQHRDWALFGFEPQEVIQQLKLLSQNGHLLVQSSGEIVQISWRYKSISECLHPLTKGQI
jgi:hypothetical protein